MALLLVQLGPQAAQVLGIFGLLVAFTGLALPGALFVVEALAVLLLPALNVPSGMVSVLSRWTPGGGDELVLRL